VSAADSRARVRASRGVCARLKSALLNAGAAILAALVAAPAVGADDPLWSALRQGGHVVLMRHAVTMPGVGDPPDFRLGDCATQRNLSAEGQTQARDIGAGLQRRNIVIADVLSSRWCRCLETARLAFARVTPWPALDSFFSEPGRRDAQTGMVRQRIAEFRGPGTLVLVTHQVNITALTGLFPAQGEMIVLAPTPEGGRVLGRLPPVTR